MYGHMYMVSNSGQDYVFMDLFSSSGDITTLTGKGPSAAVSYAGLPAADSPLFESLIGETLVRSIGTGFSPISVQAVQTVPEIDPAGMGSVLALIGGGLGLLECRRKRSWRTHAIVFVTAGLPTWVGEPVRVRRRMRRNFG